MIGEDPLFAESRAAVGSKGFSSVIGIDSFPGDVTGGTLLWTALMYCLLLLPDDKQAVLLTSEVLCYLHECAPRAIVSDYVPPNRGMSSNIPFVEWCQAFPLVICQLLLSHCMYSTAIPTSNITISSICRSGIKNTINKLTKIPDVVTELYRSICSLR